MNFIFSVLGLVIPLLLSIAFLTLLERKVMGSMQMRRGPNVVGVFGLLQPIADGVKLVLKETIIPYRANKGLFVVAPIIIFALNLVSWCCVPLSPGAAVINTDVAILYLLALSSLNVYAVIMAGWASNSNYALLGALRAAAQMISYEICLSFTLLPVIAAAGSFNLTDIVNAQQNIWFVVPFFPAFIMFVISALAETSRAPFDLPEAEAELVAGYNVEYSSLSFALFFLAEYSHVLLASALAVLCFLGGWLPNWGILSAFIVAIKITTMAFVFIWVRASLPRYRFDQLMAVGWKALLPLSLGYFVFSVGIIFLL